MDALRDLIGQMGYREDGTHPEGRRLVFLGDLTDRGPESAAVVALVRGLVGADPPRAQCVLGNHDLNILLDRRREGNDWFFGEPEAQRQQIQEFLRGLPLALERPGLRVVHACWDDGMVEAARAAGDAVELYRAHARRIEEADARNPLLDDIDRGLNAQNLNPVKLLTSGPERRAATPFVKGGKLRHEERVEWWAGYAGPAACVFGHYALRADRPHVFGRAVCVDYACGYRAEERRAPGFGGRFQNRLAAARFPEGLILFDDGSSEVIGT
jgi:hypothetical protein